MSDHNFRFQLQAPFQPTGDQPQAIEKLTRGIEEGQKHQVLLGVTGSGKTFTIANVIERTQRPTLVIAHNKTLAAQLYQEFRDFFPNNAVSYFVSYYDYYQPEAYLPSSDTYIEKEATINDEIDRLRLATTTNLLTRPDAIVVASVSCIYNLGSPVEYGRYLLRLAAGEVIQLKTVLLQLANLQYERNQTELRRGCYQLRGESLLIWPAYEEAVLRLDFFGHQIERLEWLDPLTGYPSALTPKENTAEAIIYPAKHYLVDPHKRAEALATIRRDLASRLATFQEAGKVIEAYRLRQKVEYDLEMIEQFGFVNGIENYSRYFDGRSPGEPPFTLLDYLTENARRFGKASFLTIIDESHISIPQITGMFRGDEARKQTLIEYGFRLPSALDNRPLRYAEFEARTPQVIAVSATPARFEVEQAAGRVIEQLIRPTGLLDPLVEVRPSEGQIFDLSQEIFQRKEKGERVLVTTLTKKMAEDLTEYLNQPTTEEGRPRVAYLHSDIKTLERSDILKQLRAGAYDVVVGINLLREGLDLPEVSLVAILDADKEGFLRSETSLIQTMGRAARHLSGKVILYADRSTGSMRRAIAETERRRQVQEQYNLDHQLRPSSIVKPIRSDMITSRPESETPAGAERTSSPTSPQLKIKLSAQETIELHQLQASHYTPAERKLIIKKLRQAMRLAAKELDFELAAQLRDKMVELDL